MLWLMALRSSSPCLPIIVDAGLVSEALLNRWANIYIDYMFKDQTLAREWAARFLPKEYEGIVGSKVRAELRKRGYKVLD